MISIGQQHRYHMLDWASQAVSKYKSVLSSAVQVIAQVFFLCVLLPVVLTHRHRVTSAHPAQRPFNEKM